MTDTYLKKYKNYKSEYTRMKYKSQNIDIDQLWSDNKDNYYFLPITATNNGENIINNCKKLKDFGHSYSTLVNLENIKDLYYDINIGIESPSKLTTFSAGYVYFITSLVYYNSKLYLVEEFEDRVDIYIVYKKCIDDVIREYTIKKEHMIAIQNNQEIQAEIGHNIQEFIPMIEIELCNLTNKLVEKSFLGKVSDLVYRIWTS
jgi:hypothetical protein